MGDRAADERELTSGCRGRERLTAIFRVADADLTSTTATFVAVVDPGTRIYFYSTGVVSRYLSIFRYFAS